MLVVSCGYEIWSINLREEYNLQVTDNIMLKKILVLKRIKYKTNLEYYITRALGIYSHYLVIVRQ
jgi:hypothetical protein